MSDAPIPLRTVASQPLPDCMMPDGAEPCAGFRYEAERRTELQDEIIRLRAALKALIYECSAAGFDAAKDFGWPKVMKTARDALI